MDRAERFGRAADPQTVERIVIEQHQRPAEFGQRLFEAAHFGAGMQPGIDAEPHSPGSVRLQPEMRRLADEIAAGEHRAVHLLRKLGDVAAIDEHHRLFAIDQRDAGRASETGQPRQPLRRSWHIFALIFVGARHQKRIDAKRIEACPQRLDAFAPILRR